MAPKVDGNDNFKLFEFLKPIEILPKPLIKPQPIEPFPFDKEINKQTNSIAYGGQQRDRLERLLGAGTAGMSNSIFAYRGKAFQDASIAYHRVMTNGINNFDKSPDLDKLTKQAIGEYEKVLRQRGVNPSEAPNYSIVNQLNMLDAESSRSGNLFTLDHKAMKNLVSTEPPPKVFTRMLWTGERDAANPDSRLAIDSPDAHLAYFDPKTKQGKTIAWSTTPEDLMGSRLDYKEVMRRIGWTEKQIAEADPKQFKLAVFTEESAVNLRVPTNDTVIKTATGDKYNFKNYKGQTDDFWKKVVNYDYETKLKSAKTVGLEKKFLEFADTLPPDEAIIAKARYQMEYSMGVNPLFSGDGLTKRPDAVNNRVGGREYITDNLTDNASLFEMAKNGQIAFLDLQDHNVTAKTPVNISETPITAPALSRRQMLFSETKSGALMGGTFSAATSLYQVFGQGEKFDARNFAANTTLGTGVGAFSSAGERVIGNRIADSLSRSNLAQRGLDKLYTNGAAQNFVSRMAGTEASNITSTTFKATTRTIAGRIGGAGVIGGIVNGGFAAYDQIGAYKRGEVTGSQAIGTVTGEAAVGVGAGLAGAAAGAAIGSIIPGAGTIVGGIIGFGVGMAAGYLADKGLRGLGVNTMIAKGVTSIIDGGAELAGQAKELGSQAVNAVGDFADDVGGKISGGLKSIFG